MASIGKLALLLSVNAEQFESGLKTATRGVNQFSGVVGSLGSGPAAFFTTSLGAINPVAAGAAAAVTGLAGKFSDLTKASEEHILSQLKLAERFNVTTNEMAGLQFVATKTGLGDEGLTHGLDIFARKLGEAAAGSAEASRGFTRLGLDVDRLQEMSLKDALAQTSQALKDISNPSDRAAAAFGIFGKSAGALNPLLKQGAAGFEDAQRKAELYGNSISKFDAERIRANKVAVKELGLAWDGLWNRLTAAMSPATNAGTGILTNFLANASRAIQGFQNGLRNTKIGLGLGTAEDIEQGKIAAGLKEDPGIAQAASQARKMSIVELEGALQKQIDTFGRSKEAMQLYELEQKAGAAGDLDRARSLIEEKEALDELTKLAGPGNVFTQMAAAADRLDQALMQNEISFAGYQAALAKLDREQSSRITGAAFAAMAEAQTPAQQYAEKLKELNKLLELNTISSETMARGIDKATEAFRSAQKGMLSGLGINPLPLDEYREKLERLRAALERADITQDQFARGAANALDALEKSLGNREARLAPALLLGSQGEMSLRAQIDAEGAVGTTDVAGTIKEAIRQQVKLQEEANEKLTKIEENTRGGGDILDF